MLEDRPLQFEQSVDIDIDSQTSIQPQCIYISHWEMSASHFYPHLYAMGKLHLQRCIVSHRARAKIIARHVHSARIRVALRKMKCYTFMLSVKREKLLCTITTVQLKFILFLFLIRLFLNQCKSITLQKIATKCNESKNLFEFFYFVTAILVICTRTLVLQFILFSKFLIH